MDHRMLIFAAALELFALSDPARSLTQKSDDYFLTDFRGTSSVPVSLEISTYRGLSAIRRIAPGYQENTGETFLPFTCAQLLVIDEIELLVEPFDCD